MTRTRAPELSGAGGSLAAFSGKILLLHFWRSSSINCVRVVDELRRLEARFADVVAVVGLHSPKFPHEHEHATVENARERLRIAHPVLEDSELACWKSYGVRGWPTVVVIDPEGYVVGEIYGEECAPVLVQTIESLIADHDASLVRTTSVAVPAAAKTRVLDYPGKVAVEPGGRRLAISDTGHDRVLVCDLSGRVEAEFGGLNSPQGVCFDRERLVVCDAGMDRVVAIDLAGDGLTVLATGIASPWDVAIDRDGSLVIAEAGRHRLWRSAVLTTVVAGTGEENLVDGPALQASVAQPSGLTRLPNAIAFIDAATSALRVLTDDGQVATLVGEGLFDWGASDGGPESSALQNPGGVAAGPDGALYVADTFNSMIRAWSGPGLSGAGGSLRTLPVAGLDEPGGIDVLADGRLVVADTNHHRIVLIDPHTGAMEPVELDETWIGTIAGESIGATSASQFRLPYEVDCGAFELDSSAGPPVSIDLSATPSTLLAPGPRSWTLTEPRGALSLSAGQPGSGTIVVEVNVSVCNDETTSVVKTRTRHDLLVDGPAGERKGVL